MAEDFLTYLMKQANSGGSAGAGTPGYLAARAGRFSAMPTAPAPIIPTAPETDSGGSFWDALNPLSSESDWGSRALDILSRPSYATSNMFEEGMRDVREGDPSLQNGEELGLANTIKAALAGFDEGGQAWQGLSGDQKTTGADVVEEGLGSSADEKSGLGKGIAALSIDIFGDPTTYMGGAGLVKLFSKLKGAKAIEEATTVVDDAAGVIADAAPTAIGSKATAAITDGGRNAAIKRRMSPEGVYNIRGDIPMGVGTKTTTEGVERIDGAIPMGTADDQLSLFESPAPVASVPKPTVATDMLKTSDDQLDLFDAPAPVAKAPVAKEAPKVIPETVKLTTDDVPWAKGTVADRTKGILEKVSDFSQIPVPTGQPLSQLEGSWVQPGSTNAYMKAGAHAVNNAEEVVYKSENFAEVTKGKKPAELTEAYKRGAIRPPVDTPAERAFLDAVNNAEMVKPGDPIVPLDFFAIPDQFRAGMIEAGGPSRAIVWSAAEGGRPRDIPAAKLWGILHGTESTNVDLNKIFIRSGKGRKSVASIIKDNNTALNDPRFWNVAAKNAANISKNPRAFAEKIAKQNIEHLRQAERMAYDDYKHWVSEVTKVYPDLDKAAMKAAYGEAKNLLDEIWNKSVKNNPRASVQKFMNAQRASVQIREVMAEAIAAKSPPEELINELAHVRHTYTTTQLNDDLRKVIESSLPMETKVQAATAIEAEAKAADEVVQSVDRATEVKPAQRAAEAQAAPTNTAVAEKARETKNFNEITPGAQAVIDGAGWGSTLTKDQAIGVVRGAVGSMLSTMSKAKNFPSFHQMNQANMLNKILGEIGVAGEKTLQGVLKTRGFVKSKGAVVVSSRVANLMRAAEHQMDEAAGFMPNVWNGGSKSKPGWSIGQPGVVQVSRGTTAAANVPFSSSHLMDDMIRHDAELVGAGKQSDNILPTAIFGSAADKQSALWTKVVNAAVFKDKASLAAIPDPTLRKWLLNYDPAENISMASERYTGKTSKFIKAQSDAAVNHVADAKVNDSAARAAKVESETGKVAKEAIQREPSAPIDDADAIADAAKGSGDDIADAMEPPKPPVGTAIERYKAPLGEVAKRNPKMPKANNAARNTQRAAGSKPPVEIKPLSEVDFSVPLTTRWKQVFQTHAGAETLRPLMQNAFDGIKASIAESAREWKKYQRGIKQAAGSPEAALQSLKSLDPNSAYEAVAGTEDLIRGMRKRMEDLMGGTDLSRFVSGNTAVTKGAIPRESINAWLRAHGQKFQFEEGEDWMTQWEKSITDAKTSDEAIHTLHGIENAVKNATIERFLYDDVVSRYATRSGGYSVEGPYLTGVGFPTKEMAMEVKRMGELITQLQKPQSSNAFLRAYDQALRIWKTGMTIYNPAHHIKNFTGDYWLLMADGGGIRDFKDSVKLLNKYRGTTFDAEAGINVGNRLKGINDPAKLLETLMGPTRAAASMTWKNKATKHVFDEDQIMAAAKSHGIFQGAGQLEDIVEAGTESLLGKRLGGAVAKENSLGMSVTKPFAGKVHEGASRLSETRDHSVRLAHFIHGVKDSAVRKTAKMSDAQYQKLVFEDAARRARTHHPDGLDLTAAERKYARRMIPFYSWQRKSIPVIMQTAWKRPGLVTAYPKTMSAVSYGTTGEQPESGFGDLPGDQLFPSWLDENPWAVVGGETTVGGGEGYQIAKGPSEPSTDLMPMLNNPLGAVSQLSPAIRLPYELTQGQEMGTGIPIEGASGRAEHIAKQIPGISRVVSGASNQNPNQNDVLNWLLGLGLLDSGQYVDSAMYEQQMKQREGR